jgi:hypothetical protein
LLQFEFGSPRDADTCTVLSYSCLQSLSAFAKALQLNPLSKKAAAALAEGLLATGKAQEAVNWYVIPIYAS